MVEVKLDLWNRMLSEIPLKWMHITSQYTAIYVRADDKAVLLGKIENGKYYMDQVLFNAYNI